MGGFLNIKIKIKYFKNALKIKKKILLLNKFKNNCLFKTIISKKMIYYNKIKKRKKEMKFLKIKRKNINFKFNKDKDKIKNLK